MKETKTKSVTVTARQRSLMETHMRDSMSTANDTATVRTASKTAQSTSENTSRARNMAKARFGTRMGRVTREAGLKTAETATAFTPT